MAPEDTIHHHRDPRKRNCEPEFTDPRHQAGKRVEPVTAQPVRHSLRQKWPDPTFRNQVRRLVDRSVASMFPGGFSRRRLPTPHPRSFRIVHHRYKGSKSSDLLFPVSVDDERRSSRTVLSTECSVWDQPPTMSVSCPIKHNVSGKARKRDMKPQESITYIGPIPFPHRFCSAPRFSSFP